jgi:TonB-dependent starch-binding outer membrane protein SusC
MKCKSLKNGLLLFAFSLFIINSVFAQQKTITGKITDKLSGEPLPGVTIVVDETTNGTISDFDGNYILNIGKGQTLVFSYIGYNRQTVLFNEQATINVQLEANIEDIGEVVVIGYGTVKKEDATGSVVTVSSKDFNKGSITSAQDLLVGKSAGVVITTAGGAPGSGSTIRIRGGSSLNASNDPLIIIDGIPIDNNNIGGSSNFLSFVNPNDIETFTVLKDASATAIYGSRASNGVIIITTKKGAVGKKLQVSYDVNTSLSSAIKFVDVYTGDEFRKLANDNPTLYTEENLALLGTENTDWQKEIFRTAFSMDHNLSLSGNLKTIPYRVSLGYTKQDGIMKNTGLDRFTGSFRLDPSFFDGDLKVSLNAKGMATANNFGDSGALGSAINMDPTKPVKDGNENSDGYFQWYNQGANLGTANPVEQLMEADNRSNVNRFVGNIQVNYQLPFITGLVANLNVATDYAQSEGHDNRPKTSPTSLTTPFQGRIKNYEGTNKNSLLDFYLNYKTDLSKIKSSLDATLGYSWQHFEREMTTVTDGYEVENQAKQDPITEYVITENYIVSFFGRINYILMDKYLLTFTLRQDGSSRFDGDNKWGLFPSAAFAWKIKEEKFMKNVTSVSDLKLRLGWGITGQQDIYDDYPAQARYIASTPGFYYPIGGEFLPTLRPNPYDSHIKWEETSTKNIGLDFGFFKNRITGSIDVYERVTKDLLNTVTVPSGSNFSNTVLTNVGSLENRGFEISLNAVAISKQEMSLTIGTNLSYNKNTITKLLLSDDPTYIGVLYGDGFTGQKQVTRVGYPAYSYFLNKQVYDPSGKPIEGLYVDLAGKGGTINGINSNKYIYKKPAPDYLIGLSARFDYKNFDLSASGRFSFGNYVYNQVAAGASYDQVYQIGYWKNFPTFLSETNFVKRQFTSDYFVSNASFFKMDNISAGYTFQKIADKFSARVSFTAQNVFTITEYTGLDPEVNGGIDNNFYPRPRVFVFGINFVY